ncbi:uncharacterized protein LAESUDRAFT_22609 [Laetiporus sulphureus 93-53]|uniref:Uncharacterized protein n=1 Tax=Laetiporus sulphureus 93-53 TaxID=1314785 RepID=A0A165IE91_9APHY|nr:uncharacterized protein LAESUDRAFT_22609 [Laetiporus sulphureus 93-53]KZT12958.1 hypothetical protein LAESUDRAFT_22609 [Laetiporus sulphureus 93-53]
MSSKAFSIATGVVVLAILWRKLYVHHRPTTADLLSTRNPSLAALLLRDGTIQLIALLLLNLLQTALGFVISTHFHSDLSCPPQRPSRSAVHARRAVPNALFLPVAAWSPDTS